MTFDSSKRYPSGEDRDARVYVVDHRRHGGRTGRLIGISMGDNFHTYYEVVLDATGARREVRLRMLRESLRVDA